MERARSEMFRWNRLRGCLDSRFVAGSSSLRLYIRCPLENASLQRFLAAASAASKSLSSSAGKESVKLSPLISSPCTSLSRSSASWYFLGTRNAVIVAAPANWFGFFYGWVMTTGGVTFCFTAEVSTLCPLMPLFMIDVKCI